VWDLPHPPAAPPPNPSFVRRGLNGKGTSPKPLLRKEGAIRAWPSDKMGAWEMIMAEGSMSSQQYSHKAW